MRQRSRSRPSESDSDDLESQGNQNIWKNLNDSDSESRTDSESGLPVRPGQFLVSRPVSPGRTTAWQPARRPAASGGKRLTRTLAR